MDELALLVEALGLQRYAPAFAANDVDLAALRLLSEADLKELGLSLGHRRKLMAALSSAAAEAAPPALAEPPTERRQLTVMFCDLVGSTALTAALDPERMERLLRNYQDVCAGEIARFDGFVEHFFGDGVLAYFGYPRASEDAAERAAWAGLGVAEAVQRLPTPLGAPLAVRVGIASGLVVTGGRVLRGGVNEHPVVGQTVQLAARLQACAAPGTVVVASGTHRLIDGLFEFQALGACTLKGLPATEQVWRIAAKRAAATRFEATHPAGAAALVGRDQEIALLLDRWELARAGDGQVVVLSGEAGIGKSRISQALCEHVAAGHCAVRFQCSPFHGNSALQPAVAYLERICAIGPDDPAETRWGKLERWASGMPEAVRAGVALLAALLGLPARGRPPAPAPSPEQQKERLLGLLAELLTGSGDEPILFLVEDVHWIDPTTRELLDLCIERAPASRCLVLLTCRPEFQHGWAGRAGVTALALSRIGRRQSAELVESVAGGTRLPEEVLEQIVGKTDGVPLFIEELTKAVLESGLLRKTPEGYALAGPLPPLAIPTTLQDSLLARLDHLGAAKELAQIGSVIGREFSRAVLAALSSQDAVALDQALQQLVAAGLVHQHSRPAGMAYTFKHALVQDAAYGTLLLSRRQHLHARCAETLQAIAPGLAEREPEVLARHYTEAGFAERAVELWLTAGRRAAERSANLEAIGHLTKGLAVLADLPAGEARSRQEQLLQIGLGIPLMACRGYAAPETGEAFQRASDLAEQLGDNVQRARAFYGLWAYYFSLGENRVAEALAARLLRLATEAGDRDVAALAHRILGTSRYLLGDQAGGRAEIEASLRPHDVASRQLLVHRFGHDQRAAGLTTLSIVQWIEGQPDMALQTSLAGVEAARASGHANSLGHALAYGACPTAILRGDWEQAEQWVGTLLDHAREHRLGLWHASALAYRGEVLAERGEFAAAIADFRAGLLEFQSVVSTVRLPAHLGAFAHVLGRAGQLEEALATAEDAVRLAERREERWCLAELLRIKGGILIACGSPGPAEAALLEAVSLSRRQGMRGWELRACLSLGRLWRSLGRHTKAHELVSAAVAPFTEGEATADIADARRQLSEMARHAPGCEAQGAESAANQAA
jgi:class 3 adenylate cyclase/predicted ATPase